ncbi:MAG: ribonuclease Z [archaeon]
MELTFLGTSCMVPTKDRNQPAQLLTHKGENILIDCGEATQRQMKILGIKPSRITRILITHWHGDHVLGLPGLIQTIAASDYEGTLRIYGPEHTAEKVRAMNDIFKFEERIRIEAVDVEDGIVAETDTLIISALPMRHRIRCLAYRIEEKDRRRINMSKMKKLGMEDGPHLGRLQRGESVEWKGKAVAPDDITYIVKGKKAAFVFDTLPCKNAVEIARDADLLVCEAVYANDLEEKAAEYKHLTSTQAAQIASSAGVKKLILTHISQRYKVPDEILHDARDVFPDTEVAHDFFKVKI